MDILDLALDARPEPEQSEAEDSEESDPTAEAVDDLFEALAARDKSAFRDLLLELLGK